MNTYLLPPHLLPTFILVDQYRLVCETGLGGGGVRQSLNELLASGVVPMRLARLSGLTTLAKINKAKQARLNRLVQYDFLGRLG